MSLRRQLLALSLLLLSLPWAGCEFLRETERTLRAGQALAVNATAAAIATAVAADSNLLYPAAARRFAAHSRDWYLPAAAQPLIVDGYDDDWRAQAGLPPVPGTPAGVTLSAASRGLRLYLLLRVNDDTPRYLDPSRPGANGDRLELMCRDRRERRRRYAVVTAAPGLVRARAADPQDLFADRIRGTWRELPEGHLVELQLPLGNACERLGLRWIDATAGGERVRFDSRNSFDGALPWLVYPVPALEARLAAYAAPGRELSVVDRHGLEVARLPFSARATRATADGEVFWLLRLLYRALLGGGEDDRASADGGAAAPDGARIVAARATIDGGAGEIRVRETTERYLALTDRSTGRVLSISAAVLALALLCLLGYASLLSWRVRRLRDAALEIAAERRAAADFPRSRAADEIGELSRSYADLLRQIDEYNRYLRGLARSLSHELRTPMAIIGSSLEHLGDGADADAAQQRAYVERGRAGLQRLTRIVNAMSQVSRLEESLASAEWEDLELRALLQALCAAYRDVHTAHRIACAGTEETAALWIRGTGDLLAQALDKLVDNAVSFAPAASTVTLGLRSLDDAAEITVSNPGPLLPASLREHLFEPLISLRDTRDPDSPHLGLGLHVARCIAEHHGGSLRGENLADGSGVCFALRLPLAGAGS